MVTPQYPWGALEQIPSGYQGYILFIPAQVAVGQPHQLPRAG